MVEIKWIKISTDIFNDEKILMIESLPEADGIIVIWLKMLAMAGRTNNNGVFSLNEKIPYTDEMLATIFRRKKALVQLALQTFERLGMVEIIGDIITIPNWEKHQNIDGLEKIRQQNRARVEKHREKQRKMIGLSSNVTSNVTGNVTVTECNAAEEEEEEDKEEEYSAFFAQMWELYPEKKGKGRISKSKQKEIYKIKDDFEKAIQRYLSYVETRRKEGFDLKYQNGSTFFNSGYVDYLDENYQEYIPKKKSAKPNTFHNYTDSEKLSEEELEKILLKK